MSDPVKPLYGPDGRSSFFADPAMDRFVGAFLNLASELWVQNERLATLTSVLAANGIATSDALSASARAAEADPSRDTELRDFLNRVLGPLREASDARVCSLKTIRRRHER